MYLKSLNVYKSNLKIKVTLPRTFFSILLMSEVIYKQRLLNENEIVQFLQAILESPDRVLQRTSGTSALNRPVHFSPTVQFLTTLHA